MIGDMVTVVREEKAVNIAADELRVGDVVLIQTGDVVPADLRLLEVFDLEVDEFELTGEIMPVQKHVRPESDVLIFEGSNVLRGHGKAVVVATGENTEYGKILKRSSQYNETEKFYFIKKHHLLAFLFFIISVFLVRIKPYNDHKLIYIMYGALALLFLLLRSGDLFELILIRRQKKELFRHNIFLHDDKVLEEMGKIDLFCFDKTGVLTSRDIEVREVFVGGENLPVDAFSIRDPEVWNLIAMGCTVCNDLAYYEKMTLVNPIDRALMSYAEEHGMKIKERLQRCKKIYQKPFNSEERCVVCGFNRSGTGEPIYFAKGDPEVILRMCNGFLTPLGEMKRSDFSFLLAIRTKIDALTKDGSVVIALAYAESPSARTPSRYTFLCLFQLENPLKLDTKEALSGLTKERARSVILTGDKAETALKVAAEAGIDSMAKFYLTGRDIEKMPLSEVARQSEYVSVFARLLPSQKGVLIRLFQQSGHRVAMIGDGTNDTIALKAADVGISFVERSSPTAKRAAKVLINDLTDILRVMEGAGHVRRLVRLITFCIRVIFLVILLWSIWMSIKGLLEASIHSTS